MFITMIAYLLHPALNLLDSQDCFYANSQEHSEGHRYQRKYFA